MRKLTVLVLVALGLLLVVPAAALASPKTFSVSPSGGNDTHNLQAAFNAAVKAGPSSTVQLSAGHFYTNNIVVNGFKGTFRGAGEGKTFIDCLRGLYPSGTYPNGRPVPGVTIGAAGTMFSHNPTLLVFDGGHITVSGMSFDITSPSPAQAWDDGSGTPAEYLECTVVVTGDVVSSAFDQVAFIAGAGSDLGYNTDVALYIGGTGPADANGLPTTFWSISGTESVRDCSFSGHDGVQIEGLTDGRATVSHNVITGYAFGCLLFDNSDSTATVCDNRMSCSGGENVWVLQGWQAGFGAGAPLPSPPAPHYLIAGNHMLATGTAGGLWLEDDSSLYNAPDRLDATITGNTIDLENTGNDAGLDGLYAQDIWFVHNRIYGTGLAGIDVGALSSVFGYPSAPASGWKIIGNDMSGLTATGDQFGGVPTAQVWLGPDAAHCLVVGGEAPTQVLDQGTDDTLINVTPIADPPVATHSMKANAAAPKFGFLRLP
jgi:hypothetical protein